jgi:transcriptional regulator with XRE-family HTH domain
MQIDVAKLKGARLARGLSQEDIAHAAGISGRTLQRIETGQQPSFETARALAAFFEALGIDVRLTGEPPAPEATPRSPKVDRNLRWSRRGILLGGIGSLAGQVAGFVQGTMTSADLGMGLGLLGLGMGVCFLIVDVLDRKFYR